MKKIMDKLISKTKISKKMVVFLIVLFFIALVSGSIFVIVLDKSDKTVVHNYLNNFINDLSQNKIDYFLVLKNSLISNLLTVSGIWLLGISIIGIPIILFVYFSQIFTLGFSIGSILLNYKFKGLLMSLIYLFPNSILYVFMLSVLVSFSISLSIKLIRTIIRRKQIDFKIISNKYLVILITSIVVAIVCSLFETFLLPNIIKLIVPILK